MTQASDRFSGTWHNEQGSELRVELGANDRLAGRFSSGVGFGTDETFEVTGYVSGRLIAFTVNFGKFGSLTSWVGHLVDEDSPVLRTLWQMTLQVPHPSSGTELWKTIWTGANTFRPGPAPARAHGQAPRPLWMP